MWRTAVTCLSSLVFHRRDRARRISGVQCVITENAKCGVGESEGSSIHDEIASLRQAV